MTQTLAEALSIRTADVLEYSDFADEFAMQIGKYNVGILDDIKNLYLYDFGIFVEVTPDEEEKAILEGNIQMALSKGGIDLEDAIDIREIKNIKMANQLLKVKRKAKERQDQERKAQEMQMQQQNNMQAQQAAAQFSMQKIQMETQSKMQVKQAEIGFEIEKLKNEAALKEQLMQTEFEYAMELRGLEQSQLDDREKDRENMKNQRISQQSSEQSRLIDQRKNNLPPINFESNEDSLDGFDMAEFNPR
tara:strand:- start:277 stop:1020 length:744 start_codon:yes stop_codon:yes gene_type:complete